VVSIYWIILYILQIPYLFNLFGPQDLTTPALILAPYFTFNNLLAFGFVHLWVRGYFWWALLLAIINWLNLTFGYFRYPKSPVHIHVAVLAGPLAWSFVVLFWDGAAAFNAHKLPARIIANVFVWSWAVYGGFYLVAFKDWSVGFALSILACGKACPFLPFFFLFPSPSPSKHFKFQLTLHLSPRRSPIHPCHHCSTMDLCLHNNGHPLPCLGRRCLP
jgi:hypothetical protein